MLLFFLYIILVAHCDQESPSVLRSFRNYVVKFRGKDAVLTKERFRVYLQNVNFIKDANRHGNPFKLGENKFTDLSDEELKQYHGFNASLLAQEPENLHILNADLPRNVPESVDWIKKGHVTPAKDQGRCGSCWAFGSVAALEGTYKKVTGVLKDFAEQEYLECVFTTRDGCTGGATHVCFDFNKRTGHMASQETYPYTAKDLSRDECNLSGYKNSLIAAKVSGRVSVRHVETEENTIKVMSLQPITMFIEATRTLHSYKEGILLDQTCWSETNHAVAGVAYTPKYIVIKNSWGADWGESGFVKLLRGSYSCGLYIAQQYPLLERTGVEETEVAAEPSNYDHTAIVGPDPPKPDPNCDDAFGETYCKRMSRTSCHSVAHRERFCRKTCSNCWIY